MQENPNTLLVVVYSQSLMASWLGLHTWANAPGFCGAPVQRAGDSVTEAGDFNVTMKNPASVFSLVCDMELSVFYARPRFPVLRGLQVFVLSQVAACRS